MLKDRDIRQANKRKRLIAAPEHNAAQKLAPENVPARPVLSNPGGRPKELLAHKIWCREVLEEQGGRERILAMCNDIRPEVAWPALKGLMEYAYGKAPQTNILQGDANLPLRIIVERVMTDTATPLRAEASQSAIEAPRGE